MDWDDPRILGMAYKGDPREGVLFYVLYDLRKNPTVSKIHLPSKTEGGPVLLLVDKKNYTDIYTELNEMNENEGFQWMTSLIYKPLGSNNTSDLLADTPYLLIAHMALVNNNPEEFFDKLTTMQRWNPN
jgi:hypothetical protein